MSKAFAGELLKPIKSDGKSPLSGINELPEKIRLLFEHYGLPADLSDRGNLFELVLNMAGDFVPGFKIELTGSKRRRPKRDIVMEVLLIADMAQLMTEKNCSASQAANTLVTAPRFAERWGGKNKRTLENTFHAARRSPRVRKFVKWYIEENSVKEI